MNAVTGNNAADHFGYDVSFGLSPADGVLVGIGEELRSAYGDMTDADQPDHLVDLAQKLDTLIADDGAEP